jgi:hypothetical protein
MARIIVTRGVREYRRTIPHCVDGSDTVLEIGCAWGTTSALLDKRAGRLVAIDKGKSLPAARRRYPEIRFEQIDAFDVSRVLRLGLRFNKIYIDISGCRGLADVVTMVRAYESTFEPELIVVKSTALKGLLARATAWSLAAMERGGRSDGQP